MRWIEISVAASHETSELIAQILLDQGANGTEMIDPEDFRQVLENNRYLDYADGGLIDTYGEGVTVKAYFSDERDPEQLSREIQEEVEALSETLSVKSGLVSWQMRDDSEWKDVWKQYFKPFRLTERIVIKPGWESYVPVPGDVVVEMEPGMAFGTGTHETTRMCAQLGEKHTKAGDKVLDLGCGTAILALVAVKSGAEAALAVDIDDAAAKAARENVEKNGEKHTVTVKQGILDDVEPQTFDLIFMNIIADVILSLADQVGDYTGEGTRLVLSGIIKERKDEVLDAYAKRGYTLLEEAAMGEWAALVLHA